MKIVNGLKYSKEEFEGYLFRAQIRLITGKGKRDYHTLQVYTTDTDKESVLKFVDIVKTDRVKEVVLENWATKQSDDLATELINNWIP